MLRQSLIISYILITCILGYVLILQRENSCWSLCYIPPKVDSILELEVSSLPSSSSEETNFVKITISWIAEDNTALLQLMKSCGGVIQDNVSRIFPRNKTVGWSHGSYNFRQTKFKDFSRTFQGEKLVFKDQCLFSISTFSSLFLHLKHSIQS